MAGRPLNTSKELAILSGDKTYTGAVHTRCGTSEKYTNNGGCVHCARVAAAEGREARKLIKAQNAGLVPIPEITDDTTADYRSDLDKADEFTKSLDDLM